MRLLVAIFLLVSAQCSFGQTDSGVLGVGAWSKAVKDEDHILRGRLVVYNDHGNGAHHARVYLELQYVFAGGWDSPLAVHYQVGSETEKDRCLHFEVHDQHGRTIPQSTDYADRGAPNIAPYWVTLSCDSMVRLRADIYTMGMEPKPKGLTIQVEDGVWVIPPRHAPVYLSGTFTPPKGPRRNRNDDFVWQGTLTLPPVKVPVH